MSAPADASRGAVSTHSQPHDLMLAGVDPAGDSPDPGLSPGAAAAYASEAALATALPDAEVVMVDAAARTANARLNPDLFWALRAGAAAASAW